MTDDDSADTEPAEATDPSFTYEKTVGYIDTSIVVDEGTFPEGTTVTVRAIPSNKAIEAAQDMIDADPSREEEVVDALAVDITFYDTDGNELQPLIPDSVHVTLTALREIEGESHEVVHMENLEDSRKETVVTVISDADITPDDELPANEKLQAEFDAEHFSVYAIIGTDGNTIPFWTFHYTHNNLPIKDPADESKEFTQKVKDGDTLVEPIEPEATLGNDREFQGWYYTESNSNPSSVRGKKVSFGQFSMPSDAITQDVYVEARFSNNFKVIFYEEVSAGVFEIVEVKTTDGTDGGKVFYNGVEPELSSNEMLVGWVDKNDATTKYLVQSNEDLNYVTVNNANMELVAIIDKAFTIQYNGNVVSSGVTRGYASVPDARKASYNQPVGELGDSERTGFKFKGWYKSKAEADDYTNNTAITSNTIFAESDIDSSGILTLYAAWEGEQVKARVFVWKEVQDSAAGRSVTINGTTKKYAFDADYEFEETAGTVYTDTSAFWNVVNDKRTSEQSAMDKYYDKVTGNVGTYTDNHEHTVLGNGNSIFNVYLDLKEIIIVFQLQSANQNDTSVGMTVNGTRYVLNGLNSTAFNTPPFSSSGERYGNNNSGLLENQYSVRLNEFKNGKNYKYGFWHVDNNHAYYAFKAKLGDNIENYWPQKVRYHSQDLYAWQRSSGKADTQANRNDTSTTGRNHVTSMHYLEQEIADIALDGYLLRAKNLTSTQSVTLNYFLQNTDDTWPETANENMSETIQSSTSEGTTIAHKSIIGYTFLEERDSTETVKNFYYTRNKYKIEFSNVGTIISDKEVPNVAWGTDLTSYSMPDATYMNAHRPSGNQYTNSKFMGWYLERDHVTKVDFSDGWEMPQHDLLLYAKWGNDPITITFDLNGGNIGGSTADIVYSNVESGTRLYENGLSVPEDPVRENYKFGGWTFTNGAEAVPAGQVLESDTTFVAKWIGMEEYTVVYTGTEDTPPVDSNRYEDGAHGVILKFDSHQSGKYFHGWKLPSGDDTYHEGDVFPIRAADADEYNRIYLTAVYGDDLPDPVKIIYHANYPDGTDATTTSESVLENTEITTPNSSNFTYTGYILSAWNTEQDGTGRAITPGAKVVADNNGVTNGENHLYAQWEAAPAYYTVEFYFENENGVFQHDANKDDKTGKGKVGSTVSLDLSKYSFTGYTHIPDGHAQKGNEVLSGTITTTGAVRDTGDGGDGITLEGSLILKAYYYRNAYRVTYQYEGELPEGALPTQAALANYDPDEHKWGSTVTTRADATAPGYTFAWMLDGNNVSGTTFTMPNRDDVILYGRFTSRTDIAYTIEYYRQLLTVPANVSSALASNGAKQVGGAWYYRSGDKFYERVDTDTASKNDGTTGQSVTVSGSDIKSYAGFTPSTVNPERTGIVAGDGTTVLRLLYDRAQYTVSYAFDGSPVPAEMKGAPNTAAVPAGATYSYGATVTLSDYTGDVPAGYTFNGWEVALSDGTHRYLYNRTTGTWTHTLPDGTTNNTNSFTMPATNLDIKGTFASGRANFKIVHYLEDDNGTYQKDKEYWRYDVTSASDPTPKEIGASVGSEGRAIPLSDYTNGGYVFDHGVKSSGIDTSGTEVAGSVGYVAGTVLGDHSLVLSLYYRRKSGLKLTYIVDGPISKWPAGAAFTDATEVGNSKQKTDSVTYAYGETVTLKSPSEIGVTVPAGYTLGWHTYGDDIENIVTESGSTRVVSFSMPGRDARVHGEFIPNTNTKYKIRHYQEVAKETATNNSSAYDVTTGAGEEIRYWKIVPEFTNALGETESGSYEHTGTTGAQVTASERSTEIFTGGYSYEFSKVLNSTESGENTEATTVSRTAHINGNGELTFEFYYGLNKHKVTYQWEGATGGLVDNPTKPADTEYQYDATVTVADAATDQVKDGYRFVGWYRGDTEVTGTSFTMPDNDVTIIGKIEARNDTAYTIEHYVQNADGTFPSTPSWSYPGQGTTGASVTAVPRADHFATDDGRNKYDVGSYTYSQEETNASGRQMDVVTVGSSDTGVSGNIANDGTLVLKLYYTRDTFTVSYRYDGTIPTVGLNPTQEVLSGDAYTGTYRWGQSVTVKDAATATGYTFSGWLLNGAPTEGSFIMPSSDVTLIGRFTAGTSKYYVRHFKEVLDTASLSEDIKNGENDTDLTSVSDTYYKTNGRIYKLDGTREEKDGTTDLPVTLDNNAARSYPTNTDYYGYTVDTDHSIRSGMVTADNTLQLTLFYNLDVQQVVYAFDGHPIPSEMVPSNDVTLPSGNNKTYKVGETVTVEKYQGTLPAGYTFNGWSVTLPKKDQDGTETHRYLYNTNGTWTHVKPDGNSETGTSFTFDMPDNTVDIHGGFTAGLANYRVYHYLEKTDGSGEYELKEAYWRHANASGSKDVREDGTPATGTGTRVGDEGVANPATTYAGYVYDHGQKRSSMDNSSAAVPASEQNSIAGTVLGDNSLALYLYYNRRSDLTITYVLDGYGTGSWPVGVTVDGFNTSEDGQHMQKTDTTTYTTGQIVTLKSASAIGVKVPAGYSLGWHVIYSDIEDIVYDNTIVNGRVTGFTMPGRNVTVHGSFVADNSLSYTIEHYREAKQGETGITIDGKQGTWIKVDSYTRNDGSVTSPVYASSKDDTVYPVLKGYTAERTTVSDTFKADPEDATKLLPLTLRLFYTRDSHSIHYAYSGYSTGASALPTSPASYRTGDTVTAPAEPEVKPAGWNFAGWTYSDDSHTNVSIDAGAAVNDPDGDIYFVGTFEASHAVKYTIKYWLENEQGLYTNATTEEKNDGLTGDELTVATATSLAPVSRYTFRASVTDSNNQTYSSVTSQVIDGNGTTVFNLYYERRAFEISYQYEGVVPDGTIPNADQVNNQDVLDKKGANAVKWGTTIKSASLTTVPAGYDFTWKWNNGNELAQDTEFTMPDRNVELTGTFTAKTNISYKIEYYKQLLTVPDDVKSYLTTNGAMEVSSKWYYKSGDKYYERVESDTVTKTDGTTGQNVAISGENVKTYEGFAPSTVNPERTGTVAGDGSLILRLLYDRAEYTVSYEFDGSPVPSEMKGTDNTAAVPATASYGYGAKVTLSDYQGNVPAGYTFNGWEVTLSDGVHRYLYDRTGGKWTHTKPGNGETDNAYEFEMPATNLDIKGTFTAGVANFKVFHHLQQADGTEEVNSYWRYEVTSDDDATPKSIGASVGSEGSARPLADYTNGGYVFDHGVKKSNIDKNGTEVDGSENRVAGTVLGDNSLELHLYYTRKSGLKLTYIVDGWGSWPAGASFETGTVVGTTKQKADSDTYTFGDTVTLKEPSELGITVPDGYSIGWHTYGDDIKDIVTKSGSTRVVSFSMPGRDARVHGEFIANTDTVYNIVHYREVTSGSAHDTTTTNGGTTRYWKVVSNFKNNAGVTETGRYTHTGTTGAQVTASERSTEIFKDGGYTYAFSIVENSTETSENTEETDKARSAHINGSGNLTFAFYYGLNEHDVIYQWEGATEGLSNGVTLPDTVKYKYDETVTVDNAASVSVESGYRFAGWYRSNTNVTGTSFTMPDRDVTITGKIEKRSDVVYTIEHYAQNADGTYPATASWSYTGNGTTDENVTAVPRADHFATSDNTGKYTAGSYTYDRTETAKTGNQQSDVTVNAENGGVTGAIDGNGTLVLKLYYKRDEFTVSYRYDGTIPTVDLSPSQSDLANPPYVATYRWGASVTVQGPATASGYTFGGWLLNGAAAGTIFTMPSGNVTLIGRFTAGKSNYTVRHFKEVTGNVPSEVTSGGDNTDIEANGNIYYKTNGKVYIMDGAVDTKEATTDQPVTADNDATRTYPEYAGYYGYTVDTDHSVRSGMVTADGELKLTLLYNIDTQQVVYAFDGHPDPSEMVGTVDANGDTIAASDKVSLPAGNNKTYKVGDIVTIEKYQGKLPAGYTFNGWSVTLPDAAKNGTETHRYLYDNTNNTWTHVKPDGNTDTDITFIMPDNTVDIQGGFTAGLANYKVVHYLEKDDGSYEVKDSYWRYANASGSKDVNQNGTPASGTGTQVGKEGVATPATTYAGYVYDHGRKRSTIDTSSADVPASTQNFIEGVVLGDNSLTLSLYYKRRTDLTITYVLDGYGTNSWPAGVTLSGFGPGEDAQHVQKTDTTTYKTGQTVALKEPADIGVSVPQGYTLGWHVIYDDIEGITYDTSSGVSGRVTSFTMPGRNVTVHGSFVPKSDTVYKVTHYREVLTSSEAEKTTVDGGKTYYWKKADTVTVDSVTYQSEYENKGTTDTTVYASPRTTLYFPDGGYTFFYSMKKSSKDTTGTIDRTGGQQSGVILGDGSLAFEFYYTLKQNEVVYEIRGTDNATILSALASKLPATRSYRVGESVTVADNIDLSSVSAAAGYQWKKTTVTINGTVTEKQGWHAVDNSDLKDDIYAGNTFAMPNRNGAVTIIAELEPVEVNYKILHVKQKPDGSWPLLTETEYVETQTTINGTTDPLKALTGTTVTATQKSYPGFTRTTTVDGVDKSAEARKTIRGDGTTQLILYYARDKYSVTYKISANAPQEAQDILKSKVRAGTDDVMADNYTLVRYYRYEESALIIPVADMYVAGYPFASGWKSDDLSDSELSAERFTVNKNVTITGTYTTGSNIEYHIEYYDKDTNENLGKDVLTGRVDTTVEVDPREFDGFVLESYKITDKKHSSGTTVSKSDTGWNDGEVQLIIDGDGKSEVDYYYARQSYTVTYKVGYLPPGVTVTLPASVTKSYNEAVNIEALTVTGDIPESYEFKGWQLTDDNGKPIEGVSINNGSFLMPAQNVTVYGTFVSVSTPDLEDGEKADDGYGAGHIYVQVSRVGAVPDARVERFTVNTAKDELEVQGQGMEDEQKEVYVDGDDAYLVLEIEALNEGQVPEQDRQLIKSSAGKHDGILYMDISLWLKIVNPRTKRVLDYEELYDVKPGDEIKVTLIVPERHRKEGREFMVIRVHEYGSHDHFHQGTAHKEAKTLVEWTKDTTFNFTTDLFCTYALVYRDSGTDPTNPGGGTGGSGGGGGGSTSDHTIKVVDPDRPDDPKVDPIKPKPGEVIDLSTVTPNDDDYEIIGFYEDPEMTKPITEVKGGETDEIYVKVRRKGGTEHEAYISGYPDGNFGPNNSLTRAEAAVMLYRARGSAYANAIRVTSNNFPDVPSGSWYNVAVSSLTNTGVIAGYPDGTYGGDRNITRAEFATMIVKFAGRSPLPGGSVLPDVPETHWARPYIAAVLAAGYAVGDSATTFSPDRNITRAEAVTIINKVIHRGVNGESDLGENYKDFPDNVKGTWYYYEVLEAANDHTAYGSRPSEDWR